MPVLHVVRAVGTAVDAVVGQIQRREHDDPVAVEVLLDLFSQGVDLLVLLFDVAVQENGGVPVGEAPALPGLREDLVDEGLIVPVLLREGESLQDLLVVDKVVGVSGIHIIHLSFLPCFVVYH